MKLSAHKTKLAELARKSASRGTYYFSFNDCWDSRQPWPQHRGRQGDNPLANFGGILRYKWFIHDCRQFGFIKTITRWYYLCESWKGRGEKIYCGMDEIGNKYWTTNDAAHINGARFVEPADPHWFRGQDAQCCPPMWQQWMTYCTAHSPAQLKARGEYGPHGRQGRMHPFNVQWHQSAIVLGLGTDPTYVPQTGMLVSPWYKRLKEGGFCRWVTNVVYPTDPPFMGPHDIKPEIVEDFYRNNNLNCRWSKGHDHDEWK